MTEYNRYTGVLQWVHDEALEYFGAGRVVRKTRSNFLAKLKTGRDIEVATSCQEVDGLVDVTLFVTEIANARGGWVNEEDGKLFENYLNNSDFPDNRIRKIKLISNL